MGLPVAVHVWEQSDTIFFFFFQIEYSKFEMSLNIHVVTIVMFPGVVFSHWSQHIAGACNSLLGDANHLKNILQGTSSFQFHM